MDQSSKLNYLANIPADPDKKLILLRLGYRSNITVLSEADQSRLDEGIRLGFSLCHNQGVWIRMEIVRRSREGIELENGLFIKSSNLARLLEHSDHVVIMAATVGPEVTDRIATEVAQGKASLGVVLDAVASEVADACLDYMVLFINKMLRKEGRLLTKHRYSPGYGDLPLEYQKDLFALLQLDKLGVAITERCLLVPEKSVIAISGIERIG